MNYRLYQRAEPCYSIGTTVVLKNGLNQTTCIDYFYCRVNQAKIIKGPMPTHLMYGPIEGKNVSFLFWYDDSEINSDGKI
jgi:hypothetical protein